MGVFTEWLGDPQASAAIAIGLVAGTWTLAQFRPVARERRRETHDAMTTHYAELRSARDAAIPHFPPLMAIAQEHIREAAQARLDTRNANATGRHHPSLVLADLRDWRRFGIAFTSAREILDSEAKFRSLLWSVETIRLWRRDSSVDLDGVTYSTDVLTAAQTLVHDANAFLFHYETGSYPARQTLGLLHRSLAVVSKATEPVVWERSLSGRWGRRVLRIGIAAQHFNDVTELHCTNGLTWVAERHATVIVHPRLKRLVLGTSLLVTDSPARPRLLASIRLRVRSAWWFVVGMMSPTPRIWWLSYGGARLRHHRRIENRLAGLLSVALERSPGEAGQVSLDFSWNLDSLQQAQRDLVRRERKERGRLSWLWSPRPRGGATGNE